MHSQFIVVERFKTGELVPTVDNILKKGMMVLKGDCIEKEESGSASLQN